MNFRKRMSFYRREAGKSDKGKERVGGEEVAEEQDLATSLSFPPSFRAPSSGVKSAPGRTTTRDKINRSASALSTTAQQASDLFRRFKLSLAVAVSTLSICVLVLAIRTAYIIESGSVCDSSDDLFKRCVIRVHTLSPFEDTSQCPCLALHGDCQSTDVYRGIGAVVDGDAFLTRAQ